MRAASMSSMKIGLMLPLGADETRGFDELREMALAAEAGGLDSVWGADHLIIRMDGETTGIHESWTVLTAVAAMTSRVEIGPLVLALPFRNPALTAKMAVELDEVSNGRLILGVGCGWHEPEFDAFGYPFDHRVGRFEEGLEILAPLLRGERVSFEGRYHRAEDVELLPRAIRPGGPPILIAGKQPRMLGLVAKYADQWNGAWYGFPEAADDLRTRLANVRAALDDAGRDPASLTLTAGISVAFEGANSNAPGARDPGDARRDGRCARRLRRAGDRAPDRPRLSAQRRQRRAAGGCGRARARAPGGAGRGLERRYATAVIRTWRTGASRALDAPQVRPDHPLTADGADRPAPIALEPDRVLGHEDAPLPPRARSQPRPMLGQHGRGTRDTEGDGVGQGRPVARGLEPQRIRVVQAMAAVEVEGDRVEAAAVMDRPTAPTPGGRRDPVRQLVQQREPLVERVAAGANGDRALRSAGDAGRGSATPDTPEQPRREDAGVGAHRGHQLSAPRPARSSALSQQPADLEQPRVEVRRRCSSPRRR